MRSTDIFNLDFTAADTPTEIEVAGALEEVMTHVEEAIGKLEELVACGSTNEGMWRLLGALYIGTDRIKALNDLEDRHEQRFGTRMFVIPRQRQVQRTATRRLFDMPARITKGAPPSAAEARAACATPEGAEFDFSRVRGADPGGLEDLCALFDSLPRDRHRPHMLGIEPLITGLLKTAVSPGGSRAMWDVLFAYLRMTNNETTFASLRAAYTRKFQTEAPEFRA